MVTFAKSLKTWKTKRYPCLTSGEEGKQSVSPAIPLWHCQDILHVCANCTQCPSSGFYLFHSHVIYVQHYEVAVDPTSCNPHIPLKQTSLPNVPLFLSILPPKARSLSEWQIIGGWVMCGGSWRWAPHCAHSTRSGRSYSRRDPGAHRADLFPSEAGIMVALTALGPMQTLQWVSAEALPIRLQHYSHSDEIIRKCRGMGQRRTIAEPQQCTTWEMSSPFFIYSKSIVGVCGTFVPFAVNVNWRTWTTELLCK